MSQLTSTFPGNGPGGSQPYRRDATAAPRSTAYWIFVLLVLALLSEETAYAYNLVTPALPDIAADLHTTQIAWVTTLFSLVGGISAPIVGKIADNLGKKRVLLWVVGVMACGSLIVALAQSFPVVLVGRALEGSAVAILPLAYSLMRDIFPKRLLALAISIATSGIGLTTVLGPIIAGALIDNFTYRAVFFFLAIFPVVLGALVWMVVPESPVRIRGRLDWWGALLLGAAVGLILVGLSEGATWGWNSRAVLGCFGGGAILLIGWVAYERRPAEPLIDLSLLRSRALVTTGIAQVTAQGVIALNFVLLSFLAQVPRSVGHTYGFGMSVSELARYTAPSGVISMAMGFVVGFVARRRGARLPLWAAFIFAGAGSFILGGWHDQHWQVQIGYFVYAIGGGALSAAIPIQVVDAVPAEKQAVSAGMVNLLGAIGAGLFVQLGFVILNAHVGAVIEGQPIYTGTGFVLAYYFTAAVSLIGLVATLAMRHGTRDSTVLVDD